MQADHTGQYRNTVRAMSILSVLLYCCHHAVLQVLATHSLVSNIFWTYAYYLSLQ